MKTRSYTNRIKIDQSVESEFPKILMEIGDYTETESINLSGNGLGPTQINQLAEVLSQHRELKSLDLSYNEIDENAIPFIKKIINEHPKLTKITLDFNGNGTDRHVYALIRGNTPEFNERLRNIDISLGSNCIKNECLQEANLVLSHASILMMAHSNLITDQELAEKCCEEKEEEITANFRRNRPS